MKNGFTPKGFAYSIAVDYLNAVFKNDRDAWLEDAGITEAEKKKVKEQIAKLHKKLANAVKLDTNELI